MIPGCWARTSRNLTDEDSTTTKISDILPKTGKRLRFEYEYDFGDSWHHEVVFEGCLRAERGGRYPICLEGARACPPEDVSGTGGYEEFVEAIADPENEEREGFLQWAGVGLLIPKPLTRRKRRRGCGGEFSDWRSERWV